jgi:hypothetical protein
LNVIRGLATFILSLLLFLSLTIFGMAFLLQNTLLNPDFVYKQVESVDLSELVRDFAEGNIVGVIPEEAQFLEEAIYDVIEDQEPWLKEQFHDAIYTGYDYLLGESDTLEITIRLEELKENLRESLWEAMNEQLSTWLPDIVRNELRNYLADNLEEYTRLIPDEYLPAEIAGESEELLLDFLDQYLQETEEQITDEGLMPEVSGLLEVLIKPYYDQYYDEFVAEIPDVIIYNEDNTSPEIMDTLLTAREYISYFRIGYYWFIVFMVLLAAGIFLVNWNISKSAIALSIDLLVFGILETAGILYAMNLNLYELIRDIPEFIRPTVTSAYNDALGIMLTYSVAVLAAGIILLVLGIVFKRRASRLPDNE